MQMSHLHHPLTGFHTSSFSDYDCEDRLSATSQPTISLGPVAPYDKHPMFEKPLTPSDVGKLNRLVIPKQHAEKYFPLGGGGDSAGGLLGFEDEAGKCWQFRYSYWNSSQSYVLTKGWSRYVKEKGLDAGDVVFFERHRAEPTRLFIGWRRRGTPPAQHPPGFCYNAPGYAVAHESVLGLPLLQSDRRPPAGSGGGGGTAKEEEQARTRTPAAAAGINNTNNSTRLVRLFGVDLECSHQTTSSQVSPQPIQPQQQQQEAFRNYFNYMDHHHHHHHHHMLMDMDSTQRCQSDGESAPWLRR